jgi:hypothetical protein
VRVDRLYGPRYWEYATLGTGAGTSWSYTWDTLELVNGAHAVSAGSFTQGVGSPRPGIVVNKTG